MHCISMLESAFTMGLIWGIGVLVKPKYHGHFTKLLLKLIKHYLNDVAKYRFGEENNIICSHCFKEMKTHFAFNFLTIFQKIKENH